jgi:AraC-like DNA-binding protein
VLDLNAGVVAGGICWSKVVITSEHYNDELHHNNNNIVIVANHKNLHVLLSRDLAQITQYTTRLVRTQPISENAWDCGLIHHPHFSRAWQ